MIKVIAFDFVGVLVNERDITLTKEEDEIERMFGPNLSDSDFLISARKIINNDALLLKTTEELIEKLYKVKEKEIFKKIKKKYKDIKIVIATNHISYIREFIGENFGVEYLNNLYISAEMHKIKPNKDYYIHIIEEQKVNPGEILFLDDSQKNINGAMAAGLNVIKVEKNTNILEEIFKKIEN